MRANRALPPPILQESATHRPTSRVRISTSGNRAHGWTQKAAVSSTTSAITLSATRGLLVFALVTMLAAPGAAMTPLTKSTSPLNREAAAFGPQAGVGHRGMESSHTGGLPSAWNEAADVHGTFAPMFRWARCVHAGTSCDLQGVPMRYDSFVEAMWSAVRSGHVQPQHADLVQNGLRWGFEAGINPDLLHGCRISPAVEPGEVFHTQVCLCVCVESS